MYLIQAQSPLLSIETIHAALAIDARGVASRVEEGQLEYAFDIRARRSSKACLRVFAGSLAVAQGRARPDQWPDLEAVINEILPGSHDPAVTVLGRRFCCKCDHIYHLVDDGSLKPVGRNRHPGPNGSQRVSRQSLAEFLRSRRVL